MGILSGACWEGQPPSACWDCSPVHDGKKMARRMKREPSGMCTTRFTRNGTSMANAERAMNRWRFRTSMSTIAGIPTTASPMV